MKLKEYLSKPQLLSKLIDREDLYLYLAVSDCAVSAALIREDTGEQKTGMLYIKHYSRTRDKISENGKAHLGIGNGT